MVDLRRWGPRRGPAGRSGRRIMAEGLPAGKLGKRSTPPGPPLSAHQRPEGWMASRASPQYHRPALGRHNRRARRLLLPTCSRRLVEDRSLSTKPQWGVSPEASTRHPVESPAREGERKGRSASRMSVSWLSPASEPEQGPRWEEERQRASWRQNGPDRSELRSPSGSMAPQQLPRRATGWPAGMSPRRCALPAGPPGGYGSYPEPNAELDRLSGLP